MCNWENKFLLGFIIENYFYNQYFHFTNAFIQHTSIVPGVIASYKKKKYVFSGRATMALSPSLSKINAYSLC